MAGAFGRKAWMATPDGRPLEGDQLQVGPERSRLLSIQTLCYRQEMDDKLDDSQEWCYNEYKARRPNR
jgi:hypothetical protein